MTVANAHFAVVEKERLRLFVAFSFITKTSGTQNTLEEFWNANTSTSSGGSTQQQQMVVMKNATSLMACSL